VTDVAPADSTAPRVTYISWAESCSRSDHTARELGGRSHMVYEAALGSRIATVWLKYWRQGRRTAAILAEERPDVVFVMTPPLFAAIPAFCYAWRHRARVVLDAHSAAFMHPRWRWLQWLQAWMCRRAVTTLVHNDHIARVVADAGGHATLVPDVPVIFEYRESFNRPDAFSVAVVCSFNYDEPLPAIIDAASKLPDVRFFVTGNPRHLDPGLKARMPPNMTLTGFLSTEAYGALIAGVDAVLTLTTRDHTMLRGAYEAIYQQTPVVVSNWGLLREAFPEGAVHVANTAESIAEGIGTLRTGYAGFKAGAARLAGHKLERWSRTRQLLIGRFSPSSSDS
jgi:glycosyltransferase involved in cell wall biosynthesis